MSIYFGLGFVIGLLLVAIVSLICKKKGKNQCKYDERQVAARGKAFAGGFVTIACSELVVFIIELFTGEPLVIGVPGILNIIIILLGMLVFVEVSIFLDAYFAPNKPMPKAWYFIMTLLGITLLIKFFLDNDYWYRYVNLAAGLFVIIVMASLLVKKLISRKEEKEENEE